MIIRDFITMVADFIRSRENSTELIDIEDMQDRLESLPSGGNDETFGKYVEGSATDIVDNVATKIAQYTFYNNRTLLNAEFKNVETLESNAFNQSYIENLSLTKLTNITGTNHFYRCGNLKSIKLDSLTSLAIASIFQQCTSLEEIYAPKLERITGTSTFSSCTALVSINLPSLVSVTGNGAFMGCTSLSSINCPNLNSLGANAFNSCALTKLDAPLQSIGAGAFTNSPLEALILRETSKIATLANVSAFTGTPVASGTGYIYVPQALIEDYKVATNWSTYAEQFRAIEDYPEIVESEVA